MILSDGQILAALAEGRIILDPALSHSELDVALTTSALDLRLGSELHFYRPLSDVLPSAATREGVAIDPTVRGVIPDLVNKWGRSLSILDGFYDIKPGELVLGATLETVTLPESGRLAARVEGKSTPSRLGFVVHMTAPTIHCGFDGKIVLEMFNFGQYPIRLTHQMRVCQLIFEELGEEPNRPQQTQYRGQTGPRS